MYLTNTSSYCSCYYGVARFTNYKGQVIIAFSNESDAIAYAEKVALGNVEVAVDNYGKRKMKTYVVSNDGGISNSKQVFTDGFLVAEEVNKLKYAMVEKRYFDSTDPYTILTLNENYIDISRNSFNEFENLNNITIDDIDGINMNNTVVLWYDDIQRNQAISRVTTSLDDELALVGDNSNYYLTNTGDIVNEKNDFYFVRDDLGIESYEIFAKDEYGFGKSITIDYNKGLYLQLKENNFHMGYVEINEYNVYGKLSKYFIYYINYPNNNMELVFDISIDGKNEIIDTKKEKDYIESNNNLYKTIKIYGNSISRCLYFGFCL